MIKMIKRREVREGRLRWGAAQMRSARVEQVPGPAETRQARGGGCEDRSGGGVVGRAAAEPDAALRGGSVPQVAGLVMEERRLGQDQDQRDHGCRPRQGPLVCCRHEVARASQSRSGECGVAVIQGAGAPFQFGGMPSGEGPGDHHGQP